MPGVNEINAARQRGADIRARVDQELLDQQLLHADQQPGPNQPPPVLPAQVTTGLGRLFAEAFGNDGRAPAAIQPIISVRCAVVFTLVHYF